jgi:glycosyltransferase involved in cell wall biosynthesis
MISVLMATHNGADTIDRTLTAMSALEVPVGGWKLVVVNNASTDNTEALVLKWRGRLPLEYLVEPKLGKSRAMNTALKRAEGDFIVMTDDDVLPERDWLVAWRSVADAYPQSSIFGGAIVPDFGSLSPPRYVPEQWYGELYGAIQNRPEGEIQPMGRSKLYNIAGANLAMRKLVYEQGCRFDEDFMVGESGLMGEDTKFVSQRGAQGYKIAFAPHARVGHIIHEHQISWRWIHKRLFRHGRTMFLLDEVRRDTAAERLEFKFPHWRIRRAATSLLRLVLVAPSLNKERIFKRSSWLAHDFGALWQAWILSRQERLRSGRKR